MDYPPILLLSQSEVDYHARLERYKLELRVLGLSKQQVEGLITLCRYAAEETLYTNSKFILACAVRLVDQLKYGAAFEDIKVWCLRLPLSIESEWLGERIRRYIG